MQRTTLVVLVLAFVTVSHAFFTNTGGQAATGAQTGYPAQPQRNNFMDMFIWMNGGDTMRSLYAMQNLGLAGYLMFQ